MVNERLPKPLAIKIIRAKKRKRKTERLIQLLSQINVELKVTISGYTPGIHQAPIVQHQNIISMMKNL